MLTYESRILLTVRWLASIADNSSRAENSPPTASYSLVTKHAVTRGLLTKWVIPTLVSNRKRWQWLFCGSGPQLISCTPIIENTV